MPRRAKAQGLYQRGPYWLDRDTRADGSLRSPNLAIFWYDPARGRIRSTSARTGDLAAGKKALDRHYLQHTEGEAICPTCGQRRAANTGFLVTRAVADYLVSRETSPSIGAIRPRLAHVLRYIVTLPDPNIRCEQVNEAWIRRFRSWLAAEPVTSSAGNARTAPRSASTIENSVLQLAAAINAAHDRGDTSRPAQFKPIAAKEVNRTPTYRADLDQLAAMFRYASDPRFPTKRGPLHRFLIISVATLARPDAAHDVSTSPDRGQWHADRGVLMLNPKARRQTKKRRAIVRMPYQVIPWMEARKGFFVGPASVRSAWDSMAIELGLPNEGAAGMKLIRRSVAQLVRDRGVPDETLELQLGHRALDSVSELYAPFKPDYLASALTAIESIIDEIEARVPGSFHRSDTGKEPNIVPIAAAKKAR